MNLNQYLNVAILTVCLSFGMLTGCSKPVVDSDADPNGASELATEQGTADKKPVAAGAKGAMSKGGMSSMGGMGKMKFPAPKDMKFKDEIDSNVKAPKNPSELVFTNRDGSKLELASFIGKKHVILVFTEGFNGMLCPFCQTQTSRLVANYDKFKDRDCEVIVVYPGPRDHVDEFVNAALKTEKEQLDQVPFPVVLDEEFAATNYFDIQSKHAHPSTYLIDKTGGVQFAYVGTDMTADRPSVSALLKKLDELR